MEACQLVVKLTNEVATRFTFLVNKDSRAVGDLNNLPYCMTAERGHQKEQDKVGIAAYEMKFVKKTAKYTMFGHKRGQDILNEIQRHSQFWYNSSSIATSGYSMLTTEWTGQDYPRLL